MGLLDAATGGMTGGVGALFGGGSSPSSAKAGDVRGDVSSMFGDFVVGDNARTGSDSSAASWITAAASVAGLALTVYLAYRATKK
jgi:hypothetical protein